MNVEHVVQLVMNERNEKNESFLTSFHFLNVSGFSAKPGGYIHSGRKEI